MTIASPGSGPARSSLVGNLGVALARRGQHVCVVECGPGTEGPATLVGARRPRDLMQVVGRELALEDAMAMGPEGVRFVGAGRAFGRLGDWGHDEESRLRDAFAALSPPLDMVLIDGPGADPDMLSACAAASDEVIVLASGGADGITHAYGLIKRLTREAGKRRFHVVVDRTRAVDHAQAVFENLEATARRFLSASVAWLGWVPEDADMAKAERLRQSVVCAFPASAAATAVGQVADTLIHWPYAGEDGLDGFVHRLVHACRVASSADARANRWSMPLP